jgi:CheY-like chemotaxis protein
MRVKDMLPAGNFDLLEAADGIEGYRLICDEKPNLILLDFLLPKMSGWDIYQELQKSPELKRIPLVLMSGRKEELVEKVPEPFEYFAFVEKPFEQKQLVDAIREAMTKAKKLTKATPVAAAIRETSAGDTAAMAAEVAALQAKVSEMQEEIDTLKKQLSQVVRFIKQNMAVPG